MAMAKLNIINIRSNKIQTLGQGLVSFYRSKHGNDSVKKYDDKLLQEESETEDSTKFAPGIFPKNLLSVDFISKMHTFKLSDLQLGTLVESLAKRFQKSELEAQRFIPERHKILGSNLACAHFVVAKGGAVRFRGDPNWIKLEGKKYDLPRKFVPNLIIEAIDTTGMRLMYEGFENFTNLNNLKSLKISNNNNIDDWCLDRLNIFKHCLEELEIDKCPKVTERGLAILHRLRKLKKLKLGELTGVADIELTTLLLEDYLPNCEIIGIDYEAVEKRLLSSNTDS